MDALLSGTFGEGRYPLLHIDLVALRSQTAGFAEVSSIEQDANVKLLLTSALCMATQLNEFAAKRAIRRNPALTSDLCRLLKWSDARKLLPDAAIVNAS